MLDYNLVTGKASYRMVTPRDLIVLKGLVRGFYDEGRQRGGGSIEATVDELQRHKEKGTVFLFDRGERTVGYAILINYWSNELGGNILFIDELYVIPEERGKGIAGDFIDLIAKVAPKDTAAMQLEADPSCRKLIHFYRNKGFSAAKDAVMVRVLSGQDRRGGDPPERRL